LGSAARRALVPDLGVVVAAEFAAGIADQRRHVGVVVIAQRAQRGDAADIVRVAVDQCVGGVIAAQEVFGRAAFGGLRLLRAFS
jgi:hypothetical protein